MTRRGGLIEDMFTSQCPKNFLGTDYTNNPRAKHWSVNMSMTIDPLRPGVMMETGFNSVFPNMVLDIARDAAGGYERAIQMQCVETEVLGKNRVIFTGINFLARTPTVPPNVLAEMFWRAKSLGLERWGSNDMHVVDHVGCTYPQTTDETIVGPRPEYPIPMFDAGSSLSGRVPFGVTR